jgi:hypothetical protein
MTIPSLPGLRAIALTLGLAACASAEPAPSAPPPPVVKVPGGLWMVTDIFESGRGAKDPGLAALIGQQVRLDVTEAGDVLGRTCAKPAYRQTEVSEAAFLGAVTRAREFPQLRRPVITTEVSCGGEPFGTYAQWRDGSLMVRSGPLLVRLERAGSAVVPARMAAIPPEASPPQHTPAPRIIPAPAALPAAPATSVAKELVYLASYHDEKQALRGWASLTATSPTLAGLKPETRPVDLKAKGKFIRLFAVAHGRDQARKLCAEIKAQSPDCGAAGRE